MKNTFEIRGSVTAVLLQRKCVPVEMMIDTDDLPIAQSVSGTIGALMAGKNGPVYATYYRTETRAVNGRQVRRQRGFLFHRLLTAAPNGLFVDHLNHNGLDNRRDNLRIVTCSANNRNPVWTKAVSGVRGVFRQPSGRWRAAISIHRRTINLGHFLTKEEASAAYLAKLAEVDPTNPAVLRGEHTSGVGLGV